ncbi:ubiquinone anaerobic biosynthesis accessory factor UbiT [Kordiimonas sp.]|uniref:ubiquinone anaerobic biosynthesis accessory factor UbiT n=1 Tax=Kordiimonas sp. TaxID=1970157 RepID=UPI003A955063
MRKSQSPIPGEMPRNIGLFAGRVLAALPATPLDLALQAVVDRITSSHPDAFSRLHLTPGTLYRIAATDVGIAFMVIANPGGFRVKTAPASHPARAHVSIEAPISALIALLEGKSDGDALFFARNIQVTGDTEALLMLRNAIDSVEIDFRAELLSFLGPAEPIVRRTIQLGSSVHSTLLCHSQQLQNWFQARPMMQVAALNTKVRQLSDDLASLRRQVRIAQTRHKKSTVTNATHTEKAPL